MSDINCLSEPISIENIRHLTALMAEDDGLWGQAMHIETAYVQQGLRYLTHYIEGEWSFQQAYDALKEMQP
jgi:hypothetical protein